jgi:phosphoserine phosphatase
MSTDLILHGPGIQPSHTDAIARIAGATFDHTGADSWRARNVDAALRPRVLEAALAAGIDANFMPAGAKLADFRLLAMDMDSTLITIECIDEIADMQGLKPQVAAITEMAMRGEIEFAESLRLRVALLEGLEVEALDRVYEERVWLSPGAETMLAAVRDAGLKTLLVSGGFTFFTERIADRLGLDYSNANVLEAQAGRLTGKVAGGIVDAEEKKRTVDRVCGELGTTSARAIVMGDGANDLKMMAGAGLSVAFRAKPVVRAQASVAFNFSGLDGLLALFR